MFFFFKQKTAYEMRISDWSSDVCSSDLDHDDGDQQAARRTGGSALASWGVHAFGSRQGMSKRINAPGDDALTASGVACQQVPPRLRNPRRCRRGRTRSTPRSEEHTSELQSLMRISYAVFCLKKQINHPSYT